MSKRKAEILMERFCKTGKDEEDVSTSFLKEAIITGKKSRSQDVRMPGEIRVDGLPNTFSISQTEAVVMALQERLSIIQGPPGCGKTLVVTAIVANWMKNLNKIPRILVCAPSNTAADFIAERLFQIPLIQDKVIRFYPDKREDIFNINVDKVKPYHMLSKILYMDKEWQTNIAQNIQGVDERRRHILT